MSQHSPDRPNAPDALPHNYDQLAQPTEISPDLGRVAIDLDDNMPDMGLVDHEIDPNSPAERVEDFLKNQATSFATSRTEWRKAQEAQSGIKGSDVDVLDVLASLMSRHNRRSKNSRTWLKNGTNGLLNDVRHRAVKVAIEINGRYSSKTADSDQRMQTFEAQLHRYPFADMPTNEIATTLLDQDQQSGGREVALAESLYEHTARATFSDGSDAYATFHFLKDSTVVQPFFDRLSQLAADPDQREFPGLLESVAIHIRNHRGTGGLAGIYKEAAVANPWQYAQDYIAERIIAKSEADKKLSQQIVAASDITRLLFETEVESSWQSEAIKRLLSAKERWPKWLSKDLKVYASERASQEWAKIAKTVEPFCHTARADKLELSTTEAKKISGGLEGVKVALAEMSKAEESSPEIIEKEPEPITQFALLSNTGNKKKDSLIAVPVTGIGALMQSKSVRDYLRTYRGNPDIENGLRTAFEQLTEDPYDRINTRAHTDTKIRIEDEDGNKRTQFMRRFDFSNLPDTPVGAILRKTRLFYTITRRNGKECLAFYGVDFKQATEKIGSSVPTR